MNTHLLIFQGLQIPPHVDFCHPGLFGLPQSLNPKKKMKKSP